MLQTHSERQEFNNTPQSLTYDNIVKHQSNSQQDTFQNDDPKQLFEMRKKSTSVASYQSFQSNRSYSSQTQIKLQHSQVMRKARAIRWKKNSIELQDIFESQKDYQQRIVDFRSRIVQLQNKIKQKKLLQLQKCKKVRAKLLKLFNKL